MLITLLIFFPGSLGRTHDQGMDGTAPYGRKGGGGEWQPRATAARRQGRGDSARRARERRRPTVRASARRGWHGPAVVGGGALGQRSATAGGQPAKEATTANNSSRWKDGSNKQEREEREKEERWVLLRYKVVVCCMNLKQWKVRKSKRSER